MALWGSGVRIPSAPPASEARPRTSKTDVASGLIRELPSLLSGIPTCLRLSPCQPSHAMSGRTRRRLIIAGVLVCGVMGFALRRPQTQAHLVFTQQGLETNDQGVSFVRTLVSNAGPHLLQISFIRVPLILGHTPEVPGRFQLQPFSSTQQMFKLPDRGRSRRSPCRLTAEAQRVSRGSLRDNLHIQLARAFGSSHLGLHSRGKRIAIRCIAYAFQK